MARVNFYEILKDLSPYEQNKEIIGSAIEDWYSKINGRLQVETDAIKKSALSSQIALKPEMIRILKDNPSLRAKEADDYIKGKKLELDNLASVMANGQSETMPMSYVRSETIADKFCLKQADVKRIFESHNFEIQQVNHIDFNQYFLESDIADINRWLQEINKTKKYSWINKEVNNLYELLACYNKESQLNYDSKSTFELYEIAMRGNSEYANKTSYHEAAQLFTKAKLIFENENNRIRYDNSIKLMALDDFLNKAANVPYQMKKDESFAQIVIDKIQTKFSDYDLVLAIYNYKLGLMDDPYEPETAVIHMYCGNCQTVVTYPTQSRAMKGKCPVCGEAFYKKCPSCGKLILSSSRECTYCHMDMIEYQNFDMYYQQAQEAINNLDINEANIYIKKAQNANPNSKEIKQLESSLKTIQKQYDTPLKQLQGYINNHEYYKASDYIIELKSQYPKLNLSSQERSIQKAINNAQQMFNQKGTNIYDAANHCVEILRDVADFLDAKEYINNVTPRVGKAFNRTVTNQGVQLKWSASPDLGVSYVIVRNTQHMPTHAYDGTVIFEAEKPLQYLDKDIEPGITYHYALFVRREGTISAPLTTSLTIYKEIDPSSFHYFLDEGRVSFNWLLPKNAVGVRILKCRNGSVETKPTPNSTCLAMKAYSDYTDNHIETSIPYQYRFQVIYRSNNQEIYTSGIVQDIIYEDIPQPVTISQISYNDSNRKVTMKLQSSTKKPYKVQVINLEHPFGKMNDVIDSSEISQFGKLVAMGESTSGQLEMVALRNVGYQLGIVTIAGSKAVLGNVVHISTFDKCDIDRIKTKIINKRLAIHLLEPIPSNITNLYYACKVKESPHSKPPYLTSNDLDEMRKISVEVYNKQHTLEINSIPEKELYITVIGEINLNGQIFYTSPAKLYMNNAPKTKLQYSIEWKGLVFKKRTAAVLHVRSNNVVLDEYDAWPTLYLVARSDQRIPKQYNVKGAITLARLDENSDKDNHVFLSEGGREMTIIFDVPEKIPSKAPIRLFIDIDDQDEFELETVNEANLVTP